MKVPHNRAPGQIWCLRRDLLPPYVRTLAGDRISLDVTHTYSVELTRRDARLLAKRINECLDATVIR